MSLPIKFCLRVCFLSFFRVPLLYFVQVSIVPTQLVMNIYQFCFRKRNFSCGQTCIPKTLPDSCFTFLCSYSLLTNNFSPQTGPNLTQAPGWNLVWSEYPSSTFVLALWDENQVHPFFESLCVVWSHESLF